MVSGALFNGSEVGSCMTVRTRLPKIEPRSRAGAVQVSVAQAQWLDPADLPVHEQWLPIVWRMEGPLDVRSFLAAFRDLTRRHEILRTRYVQSGRTWLQTVSPDDELALRPIDMVDAA